MHVDKYIQNKMEVNPVLYIRKSLILLNIELAIGQPLLL